LLVRLDPITLIACLEIDRFMIKAVMPSLTHSKYG
jgi:hypothetical protein